MLDAFCNVGRLDRNKVPLCKLGDSALNDCANFDADRIFLLVGVVMKELKFVFLGLAFILFSPIAIPLSVAWLSGKVVAGIYEELK